MRPDRGLIPAKIVKQCLSRGDEGVPCCGSLQDSFCVGFFMCAGNPDPLCCLLVSGGFGLWLSCDELRSVTLQGHRNKNEWGGGEDAAPRGKW